MKDIAHRNKLIFLCLYVFISTQPVFAVEDYSTSGAGQFEISAAGGINWMHSEDTTLPISTYETDTLKVKNTSSSFAWKLGAGYFLIDDRLKERTVLNHLLVEANLYHSSSTLQGDVWQYGYLQFNNYSFRAPLSSTRLLLDVKPYLFTLSRFSLYPVLGAGVTLNTLSYHESIISSDVSPLSNISLQSKTTTNFAYDLGVGLSIDIFRRLRATVEYLSTEKLHLAPSYIAATAANFMTPPKFEQRNQYLLLGLSWII